MNPQIKSKIKKLITYTLCQPILENQKIKDFNNLKLRATNVHLNSEVTLLSNKLEDEGDFAEFFKWRCRERAIESADTLVNILGAPYEACNELYIKIAMELFAPDTISDLLAIVHPISTKIITLVMDEKKNLTLKCLPIESMKEAIRRTTQVPKRLVDFVSSGELLFDLNELKELMPLNHQSFILQLSDQYPELCLNLLNQLITHKTAVLSNIPACFSEHFNTLKKNQVIIPFSCKLPESYLRPLLKYLDIAKSSNYINLLRFFPQSIYSEFIQTCDISLPSVLEYIPLPAPQRTSFENGLVENFEKLGGDALLGFSMRIKNPSLSTKMLQHFEKKLKDASTPGETLEYLRREHYIVRNIVLLKEKYLNPGVSHIAFSESSYAEHIIKMLAHFSKSPAHMTILQPYLTNEECYQILDLKINEEITFLESTAENPQLMLTLLKMFPTRDFLNKILEKKNPVEKNIFQKSMQGHENQLPAVINSIPPEFKISFVFSSNGEILFSLIKTPDILNEVLNALPKTNIQNAILNGVLKNLLHKAVSNAHSFKLLLNLFDTATQRKLIHSVDNYNATLFCAAAANFDSLKLLLPLSEITSYLTLFRSLNNYGECGLFYATSDFRSFKYILSLYPLEQRIGALYRKNNQGNNMFQLAGSPETVMYLKDFFKENIISNMIGIIQDQGTPLHRAALKDKPELLDAFLKIIPKGCHFTILEKTNTQGKTVFGLALKNAEMLSTIFNFVTEPQMLKIIFGTESSYALLFTIAKQYPLSLEVILKTVPIKYYPGMLELKTACGDNLIQAASCSMDSMSILFQHFQRANLLEELLNFKDESGKNLLHYLTQSQKLDANIFEKLLAYPEVYSQIYTLITEPDLEGLSPVLSLVKKPEILCGLMKKIPSECLIPLLEKTNLLHALASISVSSIRNILTLIPESRWLHTLMIPDPFDDTIFTYPMNIHDKKAFLKLFNVASLLNASGSQLVENCRNLYIFSTNIPEQLQNEPLCIELQLNITRIKTLELLESTLIDLYSSHPAEKSVELLLLQQVRDIIKSEQNPSEKLREWYNNFSAMVNYHSNKRSRLFFECDSTHSFKQVMDNIIDCYELRNPNVGIVLESP